MFTSLEIFDESLRVRRPIPNVGHYKGNLLKSENINEGTVTVNRGLERLSLRLIRHFLYLLAM